MRSYIEDEFLQPFNEWRERPSKVSTGNLLRVVAPVIQSAITTYAPGNKSPLLTSQARRLAIQAFERYDPAKAKLRTHLLSHLRGLQRISVRQEKIISVPEQVRLDRYHVFESAKELRDKLGRDPTEAELSDATGLSFKRLKYIRQAAEATPESSLQSMSDDGDDLFSPAVRYEDEAGPWSQFVYHSLGPDDQLIMEHTLGLNGKPKLSNQTIARQLGITPSAVSQRKAKIQAQLDHRLEGGVI
jgi:DNA-directed RNA polymerase specialized sigma subunit